MPIEISRMVEGDIDGAVECIQKAFAEDPYFEWVFPENVREYIHLSSIVPNYTTHIVPDTVGLF